MATRKKLVKDYQLEGLGGLTEQATREWIIEKLRSNEYFIGAPENEADIMIRKALAGWVRAPEKFEDRIKRLVMLKFVQLEPRPDRKELFLKKKLAQKSHLLSENRGYKGGFSDPILSKFNPKEKLYYLERERYYIEEFDFNYSSDFSLLKNMIVEEIIIARTQEDLLNTRSGHDVQRKNLSQALNDAQRRHLEALKALGITRDQRSHQLGKNEGNVADLAKNLDEKLALRKQNKIKEKDKESVYESRKKERKEEYKGISTENVIRDSDIENLVKGVNE
jgi:hypothetical protein